MTALQEKNIKTPINNYFILYCVRNMLIPYYMSIL